MSDGVSCSGLFPFQQAKDAMRIQVGGLSCRVCVCRGKQEVIGSRIPLLSSIPSLSPIPLSETPKPVSLKYLSFIHSFLTPHRLNVHCRPGLLCLALVNSDEHNKYVPYPRGICSRIRNSGHITSQMKLHILQSFRRNTSRKSSSLSSQMWLSLTHESHLAWCFPQN